MASPIRIPDQGSAVESCVVATWLVEEGARVAAGDVVLEIETDKSTVELEAPTGGVLLKRVHAAGAEVPVHAVVAIIGEPGEDIAGVIDAPVPVAEAATPPVPVAEAVTPPVPVAEAVTPPVPVAEAVTPPAPARVASSAPASTSRVAISPRAAALARERGVDVRNVVGSGPGGRILVDDVATAPVSAPSPPWPLVAEDGRARRETRVRPVTGVRRITAERMQASLAETAQLTLTRRCDASRLLALRAWCKASDPALGYWSVSVNDLVLHAVAKVLPSHPAMNAHFTWDGITEFGDVHLGTAVQTARGLLVVVVRDADRRGVRELSAEVGELAERARTGRIAVEDLKGATFTVTNLGMVGIEAFTPVLDPPQVGILGVGAAVPTAFDAPGGASLRQGITLSLTFDHRALDGYDAALFLRDLVERIEHLDQYGIA